MNETSSALPSLCLLAAIIALFTLSSYRRHQRARAIRAIAARRGLHYLGGTLPASLALDGTSLKHASSVWNVIEGECDGVRVIAFDCLVRQGKTGWRCTVIAARCAGDPFNGTSPLDFEMERAGDWILLHRQKLLRITLSGLMPPAELEAILSSVRK